MNTGILYAALAYVAWGLFPLYFKQVADVPSLEVVMHRTLWSLAVVLGLLAVRRQWAWMVSVVRQPRVLGAFALSAVLLSGNWLTYVWAVQNHHVVDASLGYFILPLVNVALGFVFLRERPRPGQWPAVAPRLLPAEYFAGCSAQICVASHKKSLWQVRILAVGA